MGLLNMLHIIYIKDILSVHHFGACYECLHENFDANG